MLYKCMCDTHPGAYVYPVTRLCGGNLQDIEIEGAMFIMNIPYYFEFICWRLSCGGSDSILMTNLYKVLQSVEIIALLRVLSILHLAICLPHRWLAVK